MADRPPLRRFDAGVLTAIMAVTAAFCAVLIARSSFVFEGRRYFTLFDDAMISMRYGRNLVSGDGLVWNPGGEAVEGYTNFLWTLLMALLHALPLPDRLVPLAISVVGMLLVLICVVLAFLLCRELLPANRLGPLAAAALTGTSYPLIFWSVRGMEVGLVAAVCLSAVLLAVRCVRSRAQSYPYGLGAVLAVGTLVRPDMLVLCLAIVSTTVLLVPRDRRLGVAAVLLGGIGITLLAHSAFRIAYYGNVLPNTYVLKVEGVPLDLRLRRGIKAMLGTLLHGGILLAVGVAAAGVWRGLRQRQREILVPAAVVVAFGAYSISVGGDAWESFDVANRYVTGVIPLLFVLASVGFVSATRPVKLAVAGLALVTALAALVRVPAVDALDASPATPPLLLFVGLAVVAVASLVAGRDRLVSGSVAVFVLGAVIATSGANVRSWWQSNVPAYEHDTYSAQYGLVLNQETERDATIAVSSAGNIPYFAGDRTYVDELGKMDPFIAGLPPRRLDHPPGHMKWDYAHSFGQLRPTLVAQAFGLTPADERMLVDLGYRKLASDAFVVAGDPRVDAAAIASWRASSTSP